jgi:hypothetical protein
VGLTEARFVSLLRRRVGLMGGGRFLDLLFEGVPIRSSRRSGARLPWPPKGSEPRKGDACFALDSHS